jgi:hypothetical protein
MIRILTALFILLIGFAVPAQASCQCRIASPSEHSDWLYLVGYDGNKIEWGTTALTIPPGWQIKVDNAGLAPSTLYYVYVYDNAGVPALELSQTGHAPDGNWDEVKTGDSTRLLVGMLYTDPNGKFWRDVQHALILNWFNRLPIFAAPPAAGVSTSVQYPNWDELGSRSANLVEILTWGPQLGVPNNVTMGISGSAASTYTGGRIDIVFGIMSYGPTVPVSSWISVTSASAGQFQNVSGASTMALQEGRHVLTFWGRTFSGAAASIYVNTFASTNG